MRLLRLVFLFLLASPVFGQNAPKDVWADWSFLIGEWTAGDSSGVPGQASRGSFSLARDLGGAILVRKNHAEYPPSAGRPAIVHDDLMIIYHEAGATRAFYDDNEGHVIHYAVTFSPDKKRIIFLSDQSAGAPRYRLTYDDQQPGLAKVLFEIAPPDKPDQFAKYVEAVVHRKS